MRCQYASGHSACYGSPVASARLCPDRPHMAWYVCGLCAHASRVCLVHTRALPLGSDLCAIDLINVLYCLYPYVYSYVSVVLSQLIN